MSFDGVVGLVAAPGRCKATLNVDSGMTTVEFPAQQKSPRCR
jgi:hypothetical protein